MMKVIDKSVIFTDEMITNALLANGYRTLWNDDNWVHESDENPDWSGRSKLQTFEKLLKRKNLL